MNRSRGFTLIELMVVIAVIGILASIAIPAFNEQMRKSRRSEAIEELSDLQLRQERYRANNTTYGTLAQIGGSSPLASGNYTVTVSTPGGNCATGVAASSANSFAITATATGAQAGDSKCATLVLTSLCGVVSRTSTGGGKCW